MPLVARTSDGERVTIFEVLRNEDKYDKFYCPFCNSEMHVVHSVKRTPHFRHNPHTSCGLGKETPEHLKMKYIVGSWLLSKGWKVDFEVAYSGRIADIIAEKDFKMAVEVQHSSITYEEVLRRTLIDKKNGLKTLWFFDDYRFFDKLIGNLESDGFKGYSLDYESTPPTIYINKKYDLLMNYAPAKFSKNFVHLAYDPTFVKTDFCPRCYYNGELVNVFEWDMVDLVEISTSKMCPMCGFVIK